MSSELVINRTSFIYSINQSVNQSTSQTVNQAINANLFIARRSTTVANNITFLFACSNDQIYQRVVLLICSWIQCGSSKKIIDIAWIWILPINVSHATSQCHVLLYLLGPIIHSFTHSGRFYSASSSPLLLRDAPDYSTDTVSEFNA